MTQLLLMCQSFPDDSDGKESGCDPGDPGLIRGLGRSPGEGNGYPLLYSCLDKGPWWATVHGVAKSQTGQSSYQISLHSTETQAEPSIWLCICKVLSTHEVVTVVSFYVSMGFSLQIKFLCCVNKIKQLSMEKYSLLA